MEESSSGRIGRLFLGYLCAAIAIFCIAIGIGIVVGIYQKISTGMFYIVQIEILGLVLASALVIAGLVALYIVFINKKTRAFSPDLF